MNCFDLHIHSNFSFDSDATIEDIIEKLIEKKYYGFSITDHNTTKHIEYIRKLNLQNILFIPGFEYSVNEVDLLLYNVEELPPENSNLISVIEFAQKRNGVVVLAHPARYITNISSELLKNVDGLEITNLRYSNLPALLEKSYKIDVIQWCKKQNKALFANSDSHNLKDLGKVGTYIPAQNIDDFLWAVKNKLCFPAEHLTHL
jgi:predicted metal-dependent phosphoesterase TrpH